MRTSLLGAALALAAVAAPLATLRAQATTLTFEGLADQETVGSYYAGGTGDLGTGPGPNHGVTFTGNAFALVRSNLGGSGNFGGEPSPGTALVFSDPPGTAAYMNVAGGFSDMLGLFYSAPAVPGTIRLFSGLDGTGTLLATLLLPVTPFGSVAGCPMNPGASFCPFASANVAFAGSARSVDFGGTLNDVVFDNITFGSAASSVVPEPATVVLLAGGLLGVAGAGAWRRRRTSPNA